MNGFLSWQRIRCDRGEAAATDAVDEPNVFTMDVPPRLRVVVGRLCL
jgi:hypothetical protein